MESTSILLVDDHAACAESMAELLRLCGYEVQIASDSYAALMAEPHDIVILELRLPRMDGWELCRRLCENWSDNAPFFIAVTTCGTERDRLRSREAGIDLHLVKPVDPTVIIRVLQRFAKV